MSFISHDSPVMTFIGKVTYFFIVYVLWAFCCIPIVTIGAATTAKYTVSMSIVKGTEGNIIKAYFKAFKSNFKQSTIIWIIDLVVLAFCVFDWQYIIRLGYSNVPLFFRIGTIVLTLIGLVFYVNVFGFVARYDVSTFDAIKNGLIFSVLHPIRPILLIAFLLGSIFASLWYTRWFILIFLFGTLTAFYLITVFFVKEFAKLEKQVQERDDKLKAEAETKEDTSEDEPSSEDEINA